MGKIKGFIFQAPGKSRESARSPALVKPQPGHGNPVNATIGQMLPVAAHSARKQTPISRIAHLIDITSAAARRRTIREKLPAPLRLPSP